MKFLGILLYARISNKGIVFLVAFRYILTHDIGELKNYFREGIERAIFRKESPNMSQFMSERRFWEIRRCFNFCFVDGSEEKPTDPLFRIRPIVGTYALCGRRTNVLVVKFGKREDGCICVTIFRAVVGRAVRCSS